MTIEMRLHLPTTFSNFTNLLANDKSCRKVAASLNIFKSFVSTIRESLDADAPRAKSGEKPKLSARERTYVAS